MRNKPIITPDSNFSNDELEGVLNNDELRSKHVLSMLRERKDEVNISNISLIPHTLVQFWDDTQSIPKDVQICMDSWRLLEGNFEIKLFDDISGEAFISEHFNDTYLESFKRCKHPAMRSDYFRLCFILVNGGFYVDADDVYQGVDIEYLFQDNKLKIQPLCYDSSIDSMVDSSVFLNNLVDSPGLTYYVNNNPIIAPPNHPIVRTALERSTKMLLAQGIDEAQNVQSTTGPGNLTISLAQHNITNKSASVTHNFMFLSDWDRIAVSKWPLDYRKDKRNWRLWDGQN